MESHSQLEHRPQQLTNLDRGRDDREHEHGEQKQSVMQKVKAKAKKIKDTIKKHGHHSPQGGHEPRGNIPELHHGEDEDDDDDDDDEDDYEEMGKDPEVHGAPIYESQVARNPAVELEGNQGLMHHQPNMERTDEPAKDNARLGVPESLGVMDHQPNVDRTELGKDDTRLGVPASHGVMDHRPNVDRIEPGKDDTRLGVPTSHGVMDHQPNVDRTEPRKDDTRLGIPASHGVMDHRPNVERIDEPVVGEDHARLGVPTSHGAEGFKPEFEKITENVSLKEDVGAPKHTLKEASGPRPANYEAKVSDPTCAGTEEITGIAPLPRSHDEMSAAETDRESHDSVESHDKISSDKLLVARPDQLESGKHIKYKDMPDDSPLLTGEAMEQDMSLQGGGYGEKQALSTAAVGDKVVADKDAAAPKLGYGDEKMNRTDDQLDQTSQQSYTEKASLAASLLADKAIGVKDAVVSKLGYGGTEEHKTPREPVDHEALIQQSGYMGKVSSDTSALADKAVEAKNVVASKLGYDQSQTGNNASSENPTTLDQTGGSTLADKAAQVKNVAASKLEYGPGEEGNHPTETSKWSEKLKPGDEDRALSELITGSVFKGSPREEDISDQREELMSASKVTESEEVAQRLGTSEDEKRGDLTQIPVSESPKEGVVDRIKLAVSSLWSGGDETSTLPHTEFETSQTGTKYEADQSNAEGRRLQESGK